MLSARTVFYTIFFFATVSITYFLLSWFVPVEQPAGSVPVKVMGLWEKAVFAELKKDFEASYPEVNLIYEQKELKSYYANLQEEFSDSAPPDVFWWHSGWGPLLASKLDEIPSSVFSARDYEKTFYPITKTDMKINGSYRGVPLEFDGLALLYNKDTLTAKNFATPPRTWTSLRADFVPSLTTLDKERLLTSAIALGAVNNVESLGEILGLLLLQNGVEFTRDGNMILTESREASKLAEDALNFYFAFAKTDHTWDSTQPNSIEAFARGKTAMVILPAYKIHDLLNMITNEKLTLNFGVENVPQLPSAPVVTWGSYWGLGVWNESSESEAAWKFVKYISEPDTLKEIYEMESEKNGFGRAYPRMEMAKDQADNIYLSAYLSQAKNAKSWYLHSNTFDGSFNDKILEEFKKHLTVIEKGQSPESALKDFVTGVTPILQNFGVVASPAR